MAKYKIIKYQQPINFDGQTVPLSMFSNKKDLIRKIVTITISDTNKEAIDLGPESDAVNKSCQLVYATRREEIFARITNILPGCKARVEIIGNPFSNNDSNVLFFVYDTRSTPYYAHSKFISTLINDNITMNSDLVSYFKHVTLTDKFGKCVNNDRDWIDKSFIDHVRKVATQEDLDILDKLRRKNEISQELYNDYVNHYIPLCNIQEKILDIIDARESPKYETNPYYPKFDQYQSRLSKSYSSYGYNNNRTESRYLKQSDRIDIIFENIHYLPLDINNMTDHTEYAYEFRQIPVPMAWSGALFDDREGILSALQVGNIVRCQFEKLEIKSNRKSCGGGAWYFSIILIVEDTIFGLLRDFYYDPKEYSLNAGDIFIFKKEDITEIPHTWTDNTNLSHFKNLDIGYSVSGCVCKFNDATSLETDSK